jgi:hypothetical protein
MSFRTAEEVAFLANSSALWAALKYG